MLVRDIMANNVISIPSDTPLLEAERIMEFHKFERLPVVDRGQLVGLEPRTTFLRPVLQMPPRLAEVNSCISCQN